MEYRFIKKDDINSVFLLGRPHFGLETEYSWDWSKEKIKQYLNKSFGFGVICVAKNYIVGFALIQKKYSSQKPNVAWINYLFVVKKYRQKNIGSDLLKVISAFNRGLVKTKAYFFDEFYSKKNPTFTSSSVAKLFGNTVVKSGSMSVEMEWLSEKAFSFILQRLAIVSMPDNCSPHVVCKKHACKA